MRDAGGDQERASGLAAEGGGGAESAVAVCTVSHSAARIGDSEKADPSPTFAKAATGVRDDSGGGGGRVWGGENVGEILSLCGWDARQEGAAPHTAS